MKREYCGLFGIYRHPEAARMTYFGLYAMQHRGQESAGIVTWDGDKIREQKGIGLVADVFNERHLGKELKGDIAVGHIRYSTTGASLLKNAQPFTVRFGGEHVAIAHNGNLVNALDLRRQLESTGSIFQTTMDSEVIVHLIARYRPKSDSIEEAVAKACAQIEGAYALLVLSGDKLMAVKDPHGFRPLSLGRVGDSYVLASETCAFDLIEAEWIRQIEPGELFVIDQKCTKSYRISEPKPKRQCVFELIYFARPDSVVFGHTVYEKRKAMGCILGEEAPAPDADYVMPFPDSGNYASVGFSQCSGLPLELCMIRNHYIGRTFIQPSQDMRDFSVRVKLNPVRSMIKGKKIVIVEDSIVRGTTIRTRVKKLRELGAREIHMRVSCPAIKHPCFYGIDFSSKGELIAANNAVEDIARFIGLDSLHYLSVDGLKRAVNDGDNYCMACFTGEYPVDPTPGACKLCLEDDVALSW